jgi:hypothetical protein
MRSPARRPPTTIAVGRLTRSCVLMGRRTRAVDGRGSRLAAGRTPRAGTGAQAASGSRSWCRRREGRARRWRPPHRWWPGRRRAVPRTAPAAPRWAGPDLDRTKSPLQQVIELMSGIESGIRLPRPDGPLGHIGGTAYRPAWVNSDNPSKEGPGRRLVASSCRRSGARLFGALKATVSRQTVQASGDGSARPTLHTSSRSCS